VPELPALRPVPDPAQAEETAVNVELLVALVIGAAAALGGMWLRARRERHDASLPPGGVHYSPKAARPAPGTFWVEGEEWHYVDERGSERRVVGERT
jgi:hypothetical protein